MSSAASTSPEVEEKPRHVLEANDLLLARAREVHRVPGLRRRAEHRGHLVDQRVAELRDLEPGGCGEIGCDDAMTAAVAEDDDTASPREIPHDERLGGVDHLGGGRDLLDSGGPACGLNGDEVAHERSRVRAGGSACCVASPGGKQDDRLASSRGGVAGARERTAVAEVLQVERDHARRFVLGERRHELGGLEVGLVAERDETREAEAMSRCDQCELEGEVAAL